MNSLKKVLQDQNSFVRTYAGHQQGIGEGAKDAVPDLVQALQDEDTRVPRVAAEALGEIGEGTKDAVPTLIQVLQDENVGVRRRVARALGRIGTPEALKAVKDFQ